MKNKNFNFFSGFFGPDFFGPEIGPRNFGRVESAPPTSRLGTSGPGRVGDGKSGRNRKPDAFLKSQRKIKISTFFAIFLVRIFLDPKLDPGILAESKVPPTSRLGRSGLGGSSTEKSGQNRKPGAFLKSRRKIKISTFFWIFLVRIFSNSKSDPRILSESKVPPTSRLGTSGLGG